MVASAEPIATTTWCTSARVECSLGDEVFDRPALAQFEDQRSGEFAVRCNRVVFEQFNDVGVGETTERSSLGGEAVVCRIGAAGKFDGHEFFAG